MIRRVEGAPKLVDPSGWISEGVSDQQDGTNVVPNGNTKETEGESRSNTESTEVERKREQSGTPEPEPYVLYANAHRY